MTALPGHMYGDPAKIVEAQQERSCHGCMLKQTWVIGHTKVENCMLGRKVGKKCKKYAQKS